MFLELAAGAFILGDFVYHRWTADADSPKPPPARDISIPRTDDGAPCPLIYGRCRVRAPVLAWVRTPSFEQYLDTPVFVYVMDQFYVIGIPFLNGVNRIVNMYSGEALFSTTDSGFNKSTSNPLDLVGDGDFEDAVSPRPERLVCLVTRGGFDGAGDPGISQAQGGYLEFLDGRDSQVLVDSLGNATTRAGQAMIADGLDPATIPGYRNYICAFLRGTGHGEYADPASISTTLGVNSTGTGMPQWLLGSSPTAPAPSFEVQSYPSPSLEFDGKIGDDTNPVDVIFDLLTSGRGKLGLPYSKIDGANFAAAAATLHTEDHGFSRSWEQWTAASELISEILRQIDATLYEDPADGKIKIKLIRNDYDPNTIPVIYHGNCESLENFAMGGWTDAPNKVRITFSNRQDGYRDGSGVAHNQANAVGQDGETREVVLQMPGVCTQELADTIAARELSARSRPIMKCRAIVDRSFYNKVPGDVVKVVWPAWGIGGVVFRVANANRGTLPDGRIQLDLIQDYYYVWRKKPPVTSGVKPHGPPPVILG